MKDKRTKEPEAEATRYTLSPRDGFAYSCFAAGLRLELLRNAVRKESPQTYRELSQRAGVSEQTVSKIMSPNPGEFEVYILKRLAAAVGFDRWELASKSGLKFMDGGP